MPVQSFIEHLKQTQPGVWHTLCQAAADGLITIDPDNDAVTATNRLLWTYPGLHEVLTRIINEWAESDAMHQFALADLIDATQLDSNS